MPIQLDFTVRRLAAMAEADPSLRDRQPWKSAYEHDFEWLGAAMVNHCKGDDGDLELLMAAVTTAFGAAGNSNGDLPMLRFCGGGEGVDPLRILVLHGDAEREFDYTAGAEDALAASDELGLTIVSVKDDWGAVYAGG